MISAEAMPDGLDDWLALKVGCAFELQSSFPVAAVMQVAPGPDPRVQMQHEQWDTGSDHHSYLDHYGNRCERLRIPAGSSRVAYEARLLVSSPVDVVEPGARETPVEQLPDETISFVMPSRFCLPDELGHEAWQRFGALQPGWQRVQAVVDFVHGHLEWVSGASNPWTTAADAYRAGQGVCRDFAHLAITFCRALNIPARYVFGYILPAVDRADGLRRLVRGLPGRPLVHVRRAQQHATDRARGRRPRPGRDRCRADDVLRPADADGLHGAGTATQRRRLTCQCAAATGASA